MKQILLAALLCLPGVFARAGDMPVNPVCAAQGKASGGECAHAGERWCNSIAECKAWCCCACTFDEHKKTANPYDGSATCPNVPRESGPGIILPDDPALKDLALTLHSTKILTNYSGQYATKAVSDGLQLLDAKLAAYSVREKLRFTVKVANCYRRAIGDELAPVLDAPQGNAEAVCGLTLWTMYRENKAETTPKQKKAWEDYADLSGGWWMAWPGATPHSAGHACDLFVVDEKGNRCFDATAGKDDSPACSIDARKAVAILTDAAAEAGGLRLDYEAWHFEWGGDTACRCKGSQCDEMWPIPTKPYCRH